MTATSLRAEGYEAHVFDRAVVNVETTLSADGDIGEARAVSTHRSRSADTAAADFEETFGALNEVWGTEEAKAYIGSLRLQS